MHKALTYLVVVCLGGITIVHIERAAAEAYDMYYLAVGISEYRNGNNIPRAEDITKQIEANLRGAGAVAGIRLVPKQGEYVTRDDVLGALSTIASKATAAKNPLIFYYFIGHGGSGRDNWSHVSFLEDDQPSVPPNVTRSHAIVETREIKESLEKLNLPYILILDNCYERKPVGGLQLFGQTLSGKTGEYADTIARLGLREPAIRLYAAKPGHFVLTVPHPWGYPYAIGPLGRRLLLLFRAAFESKEGLSVGDFLKQMNDSTFDREHPESVPGDQKTWISNTRAMLIPSGGQTKSVESVK